MNRTVNNKSDLILSLISPFAGLIYSIKNFRSPIAKYFFILFCAFYGSILIYQIEGTGLGSGADAGRYALMFSDAHSMKNISIFQFFNQLDSHDSLDFYNPLIVYFISRVTGNPHFYFMIIGLVFGLFYANNIWDVISCCKRKHTLYTSALLIAFALICSFDTISAVRMHTAFQVYFFGIFTYLTTGKKSRLIWIPLSILFHFSMFYVAVLVGVYFLIKKLDTRFFFLFFLVAHFINQLDLQFVHNIFSFMPEDVNSRLTTYSNEESFEMLQQTGKFYLGTSNLWARIDSIILRNFILIATIFMFVKKNYYLTKISKYKIILKFSLFLYGFSLIIANLPSGYRFMTISSMVFMAYFVLLFNNYFSFMKNGMMLVLKISTPFLIIFTIKIIRNILDFTSIFVFIGNFATSFLTELNIPVIEMIKRII